MWNQKRALADEREGELERLKMQAMAAIERRKMVEDELVSAKESLTVLQGEVAKDCTALRAIRKEAESKSAEASRLEVSIAFPDAILSIPRNWH